MPPAAQHHDVTDVSVVIPHYGAPHYALALARALVSQTTGRRLQVIVVDDCSPEPFPETSEVEIIRRSSNGGFGAAVNSGAAAARHRLLLILNSDMVIPRSFVEDLVAAAEPWLPAIASPAVLGPDGAPAEIARYFLSPGRLAVKSLAPLARLAALPAYKEATGIQVGARPGRTRVTDWVSGAAMLLPTTAFHEVGGFDERFFMFGEEVDLQRRLRAAGLPSVYLGDVTVTHLEGGSTDPARAARWHAQAYRRYFVKWGGLRRYQALGTAVAATNLCWNTARRATGADIHPLETTRDHLTRLWGRGAA